ncbi:MAG: helix-turn-helix domain-containing protein [Clostridia bacterium]|nr:helix-turn-helix domain-containing protein [Clostridia bacterium]
MVNKYINNMLVQMSRILGFEVGIIENSGSVVSSGMAAGIEEKAAEIITLCLEDKNHMYASDGFTYFAAVSRDKMDYVVFVHDTGEDAEKYVQLLSSSVYSVRQMHNDKYDKVSFIKNILADSILPRDVFLKSKELHLAYDACRVVFALHYDDTHGVDVYDIVSGIFPDNGKDFVIDLENNTVVVVREIKESIKAKELEEIATQITNTVASEAMVNVRVGIGTVAQNIRDIAKSYREARIALEVGKVFDGEKYIMNYDNLGIARLIYQLPTTLCELFLSEVFKKDSIDSLDSETLYTIQKFFENNLNVSETSRQLYVHRNTLVYRLDKVRKMTGLDLRIFDHAIVFKVALMVKKYLVSKPMSI